VPIRLVLEIKFAYKKITKASVPAPQMCLDPLLAITQDVSMTLIALQMLIVCLTLTLELPVTVPANLDLLEIIVKQYHLLANAMTRPRNATMKEFAFAVEEESVTIALQSFLMDAKIPLSI